jgi:very-short-patch-repair endonuclease
MRATQPWKTNRARVLRAASTSAESLLWRALRDRRFENLKFVRQCPIGSYFADFACREIKIAVEVDGATHGTPDEIARDVARDAHFATEGFRVMRVHNLDVRDKLDGVLVSLRAFIGIDDT